MSDDSQVWDVTDCDRCDWRGQDVKVRPELPCCPVPLCDRCAELHTAEVAGEEEQGRGAGSVSIIPDENCPNSQNEWGTHDDGWYEDEGCQWCGTTELNLVILDDREEIN